MAELSLLVKLVGNSASLDKATASGTKGLAAVGGAIGTADDAVKKFTGGVLSLGGALGALGVYPRECGGTLAARQRPFPSPLLQLHADGAPAVPRHARRHACHGNARGTRRRRECGR